MSLLIFVTAFLLLMTPSLLVFAVCMRSAQLSQLVEQRVQVLPVEGE